MRRKRRPLGQGGMIAILTMAALIAAALILFKSVYVVRHVEYTGQFDVHQDEITRAAGIRFGQSIFSVDEAAIRRGVNAMGEVELEDFRKRYPNTLVLQVRGRTSAGMFLFSGEIVEIDEDGYVVRRETEAPNTDLLYISGLRAMQCRVGSLIDTQNGQREAYAAVAQALRRNSASAYVSELNLSDVNDLFLLTRLGVTVRLGDASNMNNKIAWMKSALMDMESRGEHGGTLDVHSGTKADYI